MVNNKEVLAWQIADSLPILLEDAKKLVTIINNGIGIIKIMKDYERVC